MGEMLPLETEHSGGKLLPLSNIRVQCLWRKFHATGKGKVSIFRDVES
jgi:hypothetical protein